MTKIIYCTFIFLLLSCGKSVKDKTGEVSQEEDYPDGTYFALLVPVNGKISSNVNGEIRIAKFGDEFKVNVRLKNSPGGIHPQYLHTGSRCPKIINDMNRDGYVDRMEAEDSIGKVLIPFDQDISSQTAGNIFPSGSFQYSRSTSYHLMLSDLHMNDLPLERKVVAVYGRRQNMPASVAGDDLPIACGVLTRISDTPPPANDDTYERPAPRNPRPAPRPRPQPRPDPETDIDITPETPRRSSWWDRLRQRWRRWWGGGDTTVNQPYGESA